MVNMQARCTEPALHVGALNENAAAGCVLFPVSSWFEVSVG